MRLNYNCPDELVAKIDARAKELAMNRSAYMNMALARQLESEELMKNLPRLISTFDNAIEESKRVNK